MKKTLKKILVFPITIVMLTNCLLPTVSLAQFTDLHDFATGTNGNFPQGDLCRDGTVLYGMTNLGGTNNLGVIFKMNTDGTGYTKLLDFSGTTNGQYPRGSLIFDGTYLYGMTNGGGANNKGTVFKIKPDGTSYTKLLDFSGSANGFSPYGSLISDGTYLYGMTYAGGTNNLGVIFKIKTDGTSYSKLLDFSGSTNGSNPQGSLISDGTYLYGMTYNGGANSKGTVFKIKTDGTSYTKLLDFSGSTNGSHPSYSGSLISDGTYLYGMTRYGGTSTNCSPLNCGVIFKIKPDGTSYTKLLDFSGTANGSEPFGSLNRDGTVLYGTTYSGGTNNYGTIFKIKTDGTNYSKMFDFSGTSDGQNPYCSLISDGYFFYGTAVLGGANNVGTIFKMAYCMPITISDGTTYNGSTWSTWVYTDIIIGTIIANTITATTNQVFKYSNTTTVNGPYGSGSNTLSITPTACPQN